MNEDTQNMREFIGESFGDNKLSKSTELNESMSISDSSRDEYESKIHSLGGQE